MYGVFDVKTEIDRNELLDAAEKVASVRALRRTSTQIVHAGGVYHEREQFEIIGGIVGGTMSWKEPFGDSFTKALLDASSNLDVGATHLHGAFEIEWKGGLPDVTISEEDSGLIFFLLRLFQRLQLLGTVPAIDLAQYGAWLESKP